MKQTLTLTFLLISLLGCKPEENIKHVMIIGDSWGQFMCLNGSFDSVLKANGEEYKSTDCLLTTKNGTKTGDWITKSSLERINGVLLLRGSINHIVISLGGNDFISKWSINNTEAENENNYSEIVDNLDILINKIHQMRPGIKIILSGYDYGNFVDLSEKLENYVKLYSKMGKPTPEQLNGGFLGLGQNILDYSLNKENVFYANAFGLNQYHLGQSEYGIGPKELTRPGGYPDYYPLNGGDASIPNTRDALLTLELGDYKLYDPYHLNKKGFYNLAQNIYEQFMK